MQNKIKYYLHFLTFHEDLKVDLSILRQFEYVKWIPNLATLKLMQLRELQRKHLEADIVNEKYTQAWILIKYFASFDVVIYQATEWTNAADPAILGNFLYLSKEFKKTGKRPYSQSTSSSSSRSDSAPKLIRYITANDRLHPFRVFPADAYVSDSVVYGHEYWWAVMAGTMSYMYTCIHIYIHMLFLYTV